MKTIMIKLLWEAILAVFRRVKWGVTLERTVSRLVVWGLRKLASMTTNDLAHEQVNDIIKQISHPDVKLPEVGKEDMIHAKK